MCCSTSALMRWASGTGTVHFFMNSCSTNPPSEGMLSHSSVTPSYIQRCTYISFLSFCSSSSPDFISFHLILNSRLLPSIIQFFCRRCVFCKPKICQRQTKHTVMIYFWKKTYGKIMNLQYLMWYIQKSHINPSILIEQGSVWVCR